MVDSAGNRKKWNGKTLALDSIGPEKSTGDFPFYATVGGRQMSAIGIMMRQSAPVLDTYSIIVSRSNRCIPSSGWIGRPRAFFQQRSAFEVGAFHQRVAAC